MGQGRPHGPRFGSGEEETSVKAMKRSAFLLSQQLRTHLVTSKAQPHSESLQELPRQLPSPRSAGENHSAVQCGSAPTTSAVC